MNIHEETVEEKFWYDSYTGDHWLADEEWEELREFTEDELASEGIYLTNLISYMYILIILKFQLQSES